MTKGTSLRFFLVDGTADGLKVVEKSNWTGRAIVCSRAQFPAVKGRPEFNRTGVYLLLGVDDDNLTPRVYVGEGDPVLPRLESHDKNKDFWDQVVVFSSKDENLNKAHIQYLESRLIGLSKEANRCSLDNGNLPTPPSLSEADVADMETFLSEMRLVYSSLGIKIFDLPDFQMETDSSNKFQIKLGASVTGYQYGYGYDTPEGFIVLKSSKCIKKEEESIPSGVKDLRATLLTREVLKESNGFQEFFEFNQDYSFNSPSQAAGVLLGRSANGRIEWKLSDGKTLKEYQEIHQETEIMPQKIEKAA